jgi:uncharacterized protein YutE (UPF0331/DUF86 family)
MYYVDRSSIDRRLACIPEVAEALAEIASNWQGSLVHGLAQERALHLAIEIVTDVGSLLIDGFLMRDASSYEDIIDIIAGEGVLPDDIAQPLRRLVQLRKPLVQDYDRWPRTQLHELTPELPQLLHRFSASVVSYLRQELGE